MTHRLQTRKNLGLLLLAQAVMQSTSITSVAVSGLAGAMLAPDARLATLPFALISISIAASTIPLSHLMQRVSRRAGFLLGAICGVVAGALAVTALINQSFWLMCLASPFQGLYQASGMYYRYAAVEASPPDWSSRAISLVMLGGILAAVVAPTAGRYMNEVVTLAPFAGLYGMMMGLSLLALIPISLLGLGSSVVDEPQCTPRPIGQILLTTGGLTAVASSVSAWSIMVLLMAGVPLAMKAEGFQFDHSSQVIQWHVLAMYVPSLFSGALIARVGLFPVMLVGVSAMCAAIVTGFGAVSFTDFALALVLVGVGWNFLFVSSTTLLTQTHTNCERAKTQGANEFLSFGASAVGAASAGAIFAAWGWGALVVVAGVIAGLTVIVVVGYGVEMTRKPGKVASEGSAVSE